MLYVELRVLEAHDEVLVRDLPKMIAVHHRHAIVVLK